MLMIEGYQLDMKAFKSHCKKVLPQYAIPSDIHVLEEFPRTASGKINRKEIEKIIVS